jgi:methylmalonyl-CoA/ethylmalonyl-CoA epimerase
MHEKHLDHVGIAVASLDQAITLWEALVGAPAYGREIVEEQGVEIAFVGEGAGRIELLSPTRADSPIAVFLEKRGPGMHHVCYRVPDIAAALTAFEEQGFQLIDREARSGAHGHRVAFLHPRGCGGVLVELLEQR